MAEVEVPIEHTAAITFDDDDDDDDDEELFDITVSLDLPIHIRCHCSESPVSGIESELGCGEFNSRNNVSACRTDHAQASV